MENPEIEQAVKESVKYRIEHYDFVYHPPKPGQPERYNALREKAKEFALLIAELTPYGREQNLALDLLNLAVMQANAAIARHE